MVERILLVLLVVVAIGSAGCSKSESQSAKKAVADAQKDVAKTMGDVAEAFNKQKDALVAKGRQDLDDLQKKIDDLNTRAKDTPEYKAARENLDKAKAEASRNLKALQGASQDTWADAVKAYDSAMADLKKAYDDAVAKVQS
jgi:uncharacterized protein YoxC